MGQSVLLESSRLSPEGVPVVGKLEVKVSSLDSWCLDNGDKVYLSPKVQPGGRRS